MSGPIVPVAAEAKLRILAELGAVGFRVQECSQELRDVPCGAGESAGSIDLLSEGGFIVIDAKSGAQVSVTQRIDLDRYQTTSELVAIRAVEMLRAALLQSVRNGEIAGEPTSVVGRFTSWGEEEESVAPISPPTQSASAPPIREPVEAGPPARDAWILEGGAFVQGAGGGLSVAGGGHLRLRLSTRFIYIGMSAHGTPAAAQYSSDDGRIVARTFGLLSHVGAVLPCGPSYGCDMGLTAGLEQYFFVARPAAAEAGTNVRHETLLAAGNVTFTRYFGERWGLYLDGKLGALVDAPRLTDTAVVGRPTWSAGFGVSGRFLVGGR